MGKVSAVSIDIGPGGIALLRSVERVVADGGEQVHARLLVKPLRRLEQRAELLASRPRAWRSCLSLKPSPRKRSIDLPVLAHILDLLLEFDVELEAAERSAMRLLERARLITPCLTMFEIARDAQALGQPLRRIAQRQQFARAGKGGVGIETWPR